MAHQQTRSFLTDPASLVMATRQAVTNLRWRVTGEDPAHWVIYAATRASIWSWGENLELLIASGSSGGAALTVNVRLKFGLIGWGIHGRRTAALFNEVDRLLRTGPPPPPTV